MVWNDLELKIPWRIMEDGHPILSDNDYQAQKFQDGDLYE
ncbi:MAG: hypothetical protein J7L35_01970 [Anaerolineales bacterium]|nr:hypothetical protein [Anaerolineales bacterium]